MSNGIHKNKSSPFQKDMSNVRHLKNNPGKQVFTIEDIKMCYYTDYAKRYIHALRNSNMTKQTFCKNYKISTKKLNEGLSALNVLPKSKKKHYRDYNMEPKNIDVELKKTPSISLRTKKGKKITLKGRNGNDMDGGSESVTGDLPPMSSIKLGTPIYKIPAS
jgi:phage antirepressor YoqD-like protein